jgi:hypothetical protein
VHLARSAKRSYVVRLVDRNRNSGILRFVFDDYTWDKDTTEPYSTYNGKLIPARIPLSAIISGA